MTVVTIRAERGRGRWLRRVVRAMYARLGSGVPRMDRQLRLSELLQLGEKRFLAVVEVGRQRFLIGGTSDSLSLVATLPGVEPASEIEKLQERRNSWQV